MLAPSIDGAKNDLTQAYQSILSLDGFATTTSDLQIVKLPKDPDWLPPVRTELDQLHAAANEWTIARPDIWSPVLVAFIDYITTFRSFAATAKNGGFTTTQEWIDGLEKLLLPELQSNLSKSKAIHADLETKRSHFSAVLPQIDKSIQQGWSELGKEEKEMMQLASEIGGLQQLASSYGAKLTSDALSGGKSYVSSAVSLLYAAGAAGAEASIPILGIVTTVFAIGKSFYDIIEDNEKLIKTMTRIAALQQELSADAQGLALTKGTLQVLYNLEKNYLASSDAMPLIIDLWSAEETKVQDAINALKAGAKPDHYLDLLTLQIADTNWEEIIDFVTRITQSDIQIGQPVTLDIGKATIEPTLKLAL
jgi:hypothetical protein